MGNPTSALRTGELQELLNPWFWDPHVKNMARQAFGLLRPIQITDCLKPSFANAIHKEIYESDSFLVRKGAMSFYQFHLHAIFENDDSFQKHPNLMKFRELVNSDDMLSWIQDVSTSTLTRASVGASLYKPGDHTQAHTDIMVQPDGSRRRVAYVLHMAKKWKPHWGGDLVMINPLVHILPLFNALTLFPVTENSFHYVTPVTPLAKFPKFKRLAVSGWFYANTNKLSLSHEQLGTNPNSWHINGITGHKQKQFFDMSDKQLKHLWSKSR
tara:strand:+ start:278 stop:1087 length:810 start_codon:yes stop_codon:yes gene_type:complete